MSRHERFNWPHARLETKSDSATPANPGIKALGEEMMRTVAAFKEKHSEAIAELSTKKVDDVVLREHVDRINASVSDLDKKISDEIVEIKRAAIFARGNGDETKHVNPALAEYKDALNSYMRGRMGSEPEPVAMLYAQRKLYESKALSANVSESGGFLVMPETDRRIVELSNLVSPIRDIASVQTISTDRYEEIVSTTEADSGWVGEVDGRPETATPKIEKIEILVGEIYANPYATQRTLDDSFVNIEQWLASKVSRTFAKQEGKSFVTGTGGVKPKGLLAYPAVADASWAWGSVGYVATGTSAAFTPPSTGPIVQGADVIFDVIAALKNDYRPNARWLMNRRTAAACRKLKDLNANYIWQDRLVAGQPNLLAGFPVTEVEDFPDIAANSYSIAFGDFAQAYMVIDRTGVRTLRDPYTKKPWVGFYTTKRVGGAVINYEAYKLLKFGTP